TRPLEASHIEVASDDRRDREYVHTGCRQAAEAPPDRLAHAVRYGKPAGAPVRMLLDRRLTHEHAHHLVHEKGISLRLPMDRAREGGRRGSAGHRFDEEPHLVLAETLQRQMVPIAGEGAERLGDRRALARVGFAVRADEKQARIAK